MAMGKLFCGKHCSQATITHTTSGNSSWFDGYSAPGSSFGTTACFSEFT
jgi:hypothetical protein